MSTEAAPVSPWLEQLWDVWWSKWVSDEARQDVGTAWFWLSCPCCKAWAIYPRGAWQTEEREAAPQSWGQVLLIHCWLFVPMGPRSWRHKNDKHHQADTVQMYCPGSSEREEVAWQAGLEYLFPMLLQQILDTWMGNLGPLITATAVGTARRQVV